MNATARDALIWLAVVLALGAPAAVATGRALAHGWRPFRHAIVYVALLAAAADFLCYALFGVGALPVFDIGERLAAGAWGAMTRDLEGFAATFVILLVAAALGWRVTRARQMKRQYPFLSAAGPN